MAKMSACLTCHQHYFRSEAACPHCGALTPAANPVAGLAHRARMGGLMLFTALTTTACYGTPAPPGALPPNSKVAVEEPLPRLPVTGKANLFLTPKGEAPEKRVVTIESVTLVGNKLTLKGNGVDVQIEAVDDTVFKSFTGVKEALPVEKMKGLWATVTSTAPGKANTMYTFAAPGEKAPFGTLQLASFEDNDVAGHLKLEVDGTVMELYFRAALSK